MWICRGWAGNTVRMGRTKISAKQGRVLLRARSRRVPLIVHVRCIYMYWTRIRAQLTKDGGVLGAYVVNKQTRAARNEWSCRQRSEASPTNLYRRINYCILRRKISCNLTHHFGRCSSVGIATAYMLDGPGIESRWRQDIPHLSRPALRPTRPPLQWVPDLSRW